VKADFNCKTIMRSTNIRHGTLPLLILCLMVLVSCGDRETEKKESENIYEGWVDYTYKHFDIKLSPASRFNANKAELARKYELILEKICEMLEMPVPEGEINLYIFANSAEGRNMLGREIPFSDDTAIYWDGIVPYGYQLTKYLLDKKGLPESRFEVIREGLAHLLDFSGLNYHYRLNQLLVDGEYAALSRLGNNEVFDSLAFNQRRFESASLVAYIMYEYGLDHIFRLNASLAEWPEAIETIFNTEIDKFEDDWLDFAREHSGEPEQNRAGNKG